MLMAIHKTVVERQLVARYDLYNFANEPKYNKQHGLFNKTNIRRKEKKLIVAEQMKLTLGQIKDQETTKSGLKKQMETVSQG